MKKIPLTKGKYALVDDEDFDYLNQWKWQYCSRYAGRFVRCKNSGKKYVAMHRLILGAKISQYVDHRNLNKLDNQKNNLRLCNRFQNMWNRKKSIFKTSIYMGISWSNHYQKWIVNIYHKGRRIYIGSFDNERHAAMAWDIWAKDLRGEFAQTNF